MGRDELSRWRDALLVDRDDALIEAAGRWLGRIKTPFNKHDILRRLEAFLRTRSDAIVGLLDRLDRRAVALVLLAGGDSGLAPEDLAALASDDSGGRPAAGQRAKGLVDRLVLYRSVDESGRERLKAAPPLEPALRKALSAADLAAALGDAESVAEVDPFARFCALVSACAHSKPAFKGRYEPSKRAAALLSRTAPELASDKAALAACLDALRGCGILGDGDDERPAIDPRAFCDRCASVGHAAPWALASGYIAAGSPHEGIRAPGNLRAAYTCLPPAAAVSEADARRLVAVALARAEASRAGRAADSAGNVAAAEAGRFATGQRRAERSAAAVEALSRLGFLARAAGGLCPAPIRGFASMAGNPNSRLGSPAAPASGSNDSGPSPGREIIVEETHEIRVLPEAGPAIRAFVASVARLESTGLVWSASLDKEAARAAFAYGFGSAEIASRLESASGKPLPQSVRFSLDAWERESRSARVVVGPVVVLDGHLSDALEHAPGADRIVAEKLAKGVYLLAARDRAEAGRLLSSVGIEAETRSAPEPDGDGAADELWLGGAELAAAAPDGIPFALPAPSATLDMGEAPLVASLLAALGRMDVDAGLRAELEGRIRAGLVLDEGQLSAAGAEPEEPSVRDYPGKLRLLERAMKDGEPVELCFTDGSGMAAEAAGIPRSIGRTASGTVVRLGDGAGSITVPVRSVQTVRRTKNPTIGERHDHA